MRVGIGQDSHRFGSEKPLVLGGVTIADHVCLEANSDGDAVLHALCNALLTSVGKGSFSGYADDLCKEGITNSSEYLKVALGHVIDAGYTVSNVSVAIEAKEPKLEAVLPDMRRRIAEILRIDEGDVGISVTSGEGLTAFGKGQGIQAIAVVSINGA